ncbi:MAG: nitroreductase family protein [Chloroflexota bacterium]
MELFEALYARQSIGAVRADPVPRELIEKLLSAAVQAPNHHRVRPWRFVVLTGAARSRLGDAMAAALKRREPLVQDAAVEVERARPLRAPAIVAVGVDKPKEANVVEVENVCAAAAAVENLLLAATAAGLGAIWRTGPAASEAVVKEFLGFEADQHVIGFIYLGYPETDFPAKERPSFNDRVVWMGEEA